MKLRSYQEMLKEYEMSELDSDDKNTKEQLLLSYPFSVIVEGGHMEFDSLNKWIEMNLDTDSTKSIYYGKFGYNFGFAEYFGNQEIEIKELRKVIPNIFSTYPDSSPPNQIAKSNGYDVWIEYSKDDQNAIIINVEEQ